MAGILRDKHRAVDPVWHVQAVMLFVIILQLALPNRFLVGSRYILPAVEALLIVLLSLTTPQEPIFKSMTRRVNVILLIVVASISNVYALAVVADQLLGGVNITDGRGLIMAAINIYLTNIAVFALWYWEMDGGGPGERQRIAKHEQDFLFPQQQNENYKHPDWRPTFADYLYVSATNAMAFSPTDTMPLSRRSKLLMFLQATISLIAIALVAARAVNILR
jgi:hypothetical protein